VPLRCLPQGASRARETIHGAPLLAQAQSVSPLCDRVGKGHDVPAQSAKNQRTGTAARDELDSAFPLHGLTGGEIEVLLFVLIKAVRRVQPQARQNDFAMSDVRTLRGRHASLPSSSARQQRNRGGSIGVIQDTTKAARCALLAVLALCGLMASWAAAEAVTLAFLPTENRSTRILDSGALMGQIELISTTTLTSGEFSDQFVVLERAAIDDILRERTIEGDVVRSMLSSTLLVSSSVIDLPAPRVLLQQEVIAADNGRLIHSLHVASRHDDIEGVAQTLGERFPTFLRELLQRYELSQRLPLVEVTTDLQSD